VQCCAALAIVVFGNRFEVVVVDDDVVVVFLLFFPNFRTPVHLLRVCLENSQGRILFFPFQSAQQLKDIADAVICSCILFRSFFVVPEILLLESFGVY
jgi:hypothetical protein